MEPDGRVWRLNRTSRSLVGYWQRDAQETRLAALRKETADLEMRRQAAEVQLNRMINELPLDVQL